MPDTTMFTAPSFLLTDVDGRFRIVLNLDERYWRACLPENRHGHLEDLVWNCVGMSAKVSNYLDSLSPVSPSA